jgi:hypothetical protein
VDNVSGAITHTNQSVVLLIFFRNREWWETRTNRIILGLDFITSLGFIISMLIYYVGSGSIIYTASFVAFIILVIMIISHLWRLDQYLFKTGDKFVKNSSMLVLNIGKIILLVGGALLPTGAHILSFGPATIFGF